MEAKVFVCGIRRALPAKPGRLRSSPPFAWRSCGRGAATQTELAQILEMTQANVSRIGHSENPYQRTLADYMGALGGHIEIDAVFDDDVVPLGLVEREQDPVAA